MPRGLLIGGVAVFLVSFAAGPGLLRGQSPTGEDSHAAPPKGNVESISLDNNTPVPVTIQGVYLKGNPLPGTKDSVHRVRACQMTLDIDTSLYPGLKDYLDKGYLKSGVTRVLVKGQLANAVESAGAEAGGHHCVVLKATVFQPIEAAQASPGAAATKAQAVHETPAAAAKPTKEDEKLAAVINSMGGLSVIFSPEGDAKEAILAAFKDAGLKLIDSDPANGLIKADLPTEARVEPSFVWKLRTAPGKPDVSPRENSNTQTKVSIPYGERPSSIGRGR